jgi:4-amino-4-deoxy-L-arabinose transferase-like glycosyltransferase
MLRWLIIIGLAILLDLALIVWLRRRHKRQSAEHPPETPEVRVLGAYSPILTWLRYGRKQKRGNQLAGLWGEVKGFWMEEVKGNDRRMLQIITAGACILLSGFLGYAYVNDSMITGWQIWVWLACVGLTFFILFTPPPFDLRPKRSWIWLLLLLAAALALRLVFLGSLPAGLHQDEAGTASFSLRHIVPGSEYILNPFRTGPASHPTLYNYVMRLSLLLAGESIFGTRLSSAIAGALAVLATWFMIAVVQNKRTAWLAAILMAGYQYHIHWSRIGLNNIWVTLWAPLTVGLFIWGWEKKWNGAAVLSGLALGLSFYFYAGGYVLPFLMIYLTLKFWRDKEERRQLVIFAGKTMAMSLCVVVPLLFHAFLQPRLFFERSQTVFGWKSQFIQEITGDPGNIGKFIKYQIERSLGAYTTYVDFSGFYRAGVPFLFGLAGPVFLIGFGWAIYKKQYLPVLWIVLVTLLGGFLLTGTPAGSHFIASIPAICWLIAMPLDYLMKSKRSGWAIAILVIILATDLIFYFGVFPHYPPGDLSLPFPSKPY